MEEYEICSTPACRILRVVKPKATFIDLVTGEKVCLACAQKANADALQRGRQKRCIDLRQYFWQKLGATA